MPGREDLRVGNYVMSVDAQKLGRIARLDDEGIHVAKGRRHPTGFTIGYDHLCSTLRAEAFLRLPLREYLPLYRPVAHAAPPVQVSAGAGRRRLPLLRRADARW